MFVIAVVGGGGGDATTCEEEENLICEAVAVGVADDSVTNELGSNHNTESVPKQTTQAEVEVLNKPGKRARGQNLKSTKRRRVLGSQRKQARGVLPIIIAVLQSDVLFFLFFSQKFFFFGVLREGVLWIHIYCISVT